MTKTSKTIVFFGNERLATGVSTTAPTLQALIAAGYHVAAVVSNYTAGQSRSSRDLEIADVAKKHGIPLLLPNKPTEIMDELKSMRADAGVLVAYGRIIPEALINLFPNGIINIHPSLLPLHRGPTPIESVILQGEHETGVSIMALAKEMDAGPVYAHSKLTLHGNETKQALADKLLDIGSSMLVEVLPGILSGDIVGQPQDDYMASYDKLITKDAGVLDWQKPAEQLEREVRAYAEWPKSRCTLAGKEVVVTYAQVVEKPLKPGEIVAENKQILVGTSEQALSLTKLKPAGKAEMSAAAFLAGNKL